MQDCYTSKQAYLECGEEFRPVSEKNTISVLKEKMKFFVPRECATTRKQQLSNKPKLNLSDLHMTTKEEAYQIEAYDDREDERPSDTETDLSMTSEKSESWCDVDGDWESVSVATTAETVDAWIDVKTTWKDVLLKNSDKAPPQATPSEPRHTKRKAKKMPSSIKEDQIYYDDDEIFEPVGRADIEYARRSRKSKQASASRLRRLANKAKARGDQ